MKTLFSEDLKTLLDRPASTTVSLYLPMHRNGGDVQQDPIRLKNQLHDAEKALVEHGLKSGEAKRFLSPAYQLLSDELFWRQHCSGLAVFIGEHFFKYYRLPTDVEPLTIVNDRFHIKPILKLFSTDGRFAILALSLNKARLFEATRFNVREIVLADAPDGLADSLPESPHEHQLLFHTEGARVGGAQGRVYYGGGPGSDDNKDNITRYFRQIDKSIREQLNGKRVPLVIAGVEYLLPMYRNVNTHFTLLEQGVMGNPDMTTPEALRDKAWDIVDPFFRTGRDRAAKAFVDQGSGASTSDLENVVVAALQGRVDTLFVPDGVHVWGTTDLANASVAVHETRQIRDQDLLDVATVQTLLKNGTVYVVDPSQIPGSGPVAAVYRY